MGDTGAAAAAAASIDLGIAVPPLREPQLTPTAQILAPIAASEKPRVRVNPEMTAPVSAEEVAAAAAAMNRVPTFPERDGHCCKRVVAAIENLTAKAELKSAPKS